MKWPWPFVSAGRRKRDEELDEEIRAHIEMSAREREERGATADEARAAARREFGNVSLVKETTRDVWGWAWFDRIAQDVRYGLRMMRRSPGFTIVAVLTLALGIGASTAIFSVFDAVMLRPLAVRDQGRLVLAEWQARRPPRNSRYSSHDDCAQDSGISKSSAGCSLSYPLFQQIHAQTDVFSGVAAFTNESGIDLTGSGPPVRVSGQLVSGDFFQTLGIRPATGRLIEAGDDQAGAEPVVVLSYGYWQREFGGSAFALGKTIRLNNVPFTVIGVAEPPFAGATPGSQKELWLPFAQYSRLNVPKAHKPADDSDWWVIIVGRLRNGVTLAQAQASVNAAFRNEVINGPKPLLKSADEPSARLVLARDGLNGQRQPFRSPLLTLLMAVGLLLLIACANVAGLTLARATGRRKEMALRHALGATRARIARQLFTESLLLSLLGGGLGILIAYWGVDAIIALFSGGSPSTFAFPVKPDLRILAFAAGLSILTGIVVGLIPVVRSAEADLAPALKEGGRSTAENTRGRRRWIPLADALVAAQIALAVIVLASAGLLVRTLAKLESIEPGFDANNVLLFGVDPTLAGYKRADILTLYGELQSQLADIPGVRSVTYSSQTLLGGAWWGTTVQVPGMSRNSSADTTLMTTGPGFFDTMRIPLLSGRAFNSTDFGEAAASGSGLAPLPVIINETFARRWLAGQNPLGMQLTGGSDDSASDIGLNEARPPSRNWQVIGVVRDTKYDALRSPVPPTIYVPLSGGGAYFEIRTAADPESIVSTVRAVAARLDSNLPLTRITTQTEQIHKSLSKERVMARLSSFFGVLALLLAAIGIYGVIAYLAARRTHEIGIRMALGAQPDDVLRLVLGHGARIALTGAGIGLLGALSVTRLMASMLYGVSASDPATFAAAATLLIVVTLAACWIPARRATRVDPMVALRYE